MSHHPAAPTPPDLPPRPPQTGSNQVLTIVLVCVAVAILLCGGLLAGILWPALGRAREIANRSVSGANLSGLYRAMFTYAVGADDQFPDHVGKLILDGSVTPKTFLSPSHSGGEPGPDYAGEAPPRRYYRFGDYFFVYEGLHQLADPDDTTRITGEADAPPDAIIAFSLAHDGEGRNVLFGDGHVEWVSPDDFQAVLRQDAIIRSRLGLPPIDLAELDAFAEN